MAITAKMVKELRERTGAGMMDCKKALEETNGNIDDAIDYLRKTGTAEAAKKSERIAAEGSTFIKVSNNDAVLVEVNCETDFVTKNENFQKLLTDLADHILENKPEDVEETLTQTMKNKDETVGDHINSMIATIGENITLRRFELLNKTDDDVFGQYLHMQGNIGALTVLEGTQDSELARDIAMHVAAINPPYISRDDVPEDEVNREREVLESQAADEGKPEHIVEKIVEGRLNRFYEENCLLEQEFVKDTDVNVKEYVEGKGGKIKAIARYQVGEGIEVEEEDFAEEVMSQIKK